jgi:hypothetical protein
MTSTSGGMNVDKVVNNYRVVILFIVFRILEGDIGITLIVKSSVMTTTLNLM